MTNDNDWARFCAMMAAAGWRLERDPEPSGGKCCRYFIHEEDGNAYYVSGEFYPLKGSARFVGTWRKWLAAGTSPVLW